VADQLALYAANRLRDRDGNVLPITGFRLRALVNGIGLAATFTWKALYLNFAASAPLVHLRLESDLPQASVDKFGFGDARVQPLGVGWRTSRFDLVTSYALYVPTGRAAPGGRDGVSRAGFSHEFSAGGTAFFDRNRHWYLTALAGYELNQRKLGIDITRGDTIQVQGGAGRQLWGLVDVGVAFYALWQVRDDRGSDLPEVLRGSRDRVLGLGPEVGVRIPPIRTKLALRYEHDFAVHARPEGQIATLTAMLQPWRPAKP
jgi:hypothetical protein